MKKVKKAKKFFVAYQSKKLPYYDVAEIEASNEKEAYDILYDKYVKESDISVAVATDSYQTSRDLLLNILNEKAENEPQNKKDDYKDTSVYHGVSGCYEPILVMEHLVREYIKRGISADCAMNLALAVKYLMRIGTKDDVQKEMFKAENYVHRARTAGWMNPEVSQETK